LGRFVDTRSSIYALALWSTFPGRCYCLCACESSAAITLAVLALPDYTRCSDNGILCLAAVDCGWRDHLFHLGFFAPPIRHDQKPNSQSYYLQHGQVFLRSLLVTPLLFVDSIQRSAVVPRRDFLHSPLEHAGSAFSLHRVPNDSDRYLAWIGHRKTANTERGYGSGTTSCSIANFDYVALT
jgi:hypothetical protein